jgi:lipopolysaccharide transport system ATP-binding protein
VSGGGAISVQGIGKQYRIGQQGQTYGRLTETLSRAVRAPARMLGRGGRRQGETLWALRDVSFDVDVGEVVAIVGRNGAGKTTLLKILSRITEPTEGRAVIHGRAGTLLEVGTGFHPELTGRENIFLNGAILGMRRADIVRRFDEIVAFAEVERFIDTPVKRYSSGMYVRLAFAVAAHLEPEVLIVDEVLAVGDAAFQKKCLGKMSDTAREGRTVLFVSHNMQAVKSLCTRAILLERGQVVADGSVEDVVHGYLRDHDNLTSQRTWPDAAERPGDGNCRLSAVRVVDASGDPSGSFFSSQPLDVELEFDLERVPPNLCVGFDLQTADGMTVLRAFHTDIEEENRPPLREGSNLVRCTIPAGLLNAGGYAVAPRFYLYPLSWAVSLDPVVRFDVIFDHGRSHFANATNAVIRPGPIAPVLDWHEASSRATARASAGSGS